MPISSQASEEAALLFAQRLVDRAYEDAYAMTSEAYRASMSLEKMREDFELFVPLDWGDADPIEIAKVMDSWPGKNSLDLLWVYVSIGGDVYSEGLAVIITEEGNYARIREVEFGRP